MSQGLTPKPYALPPTPHTRPPTPQTLTTQISGAELQELQNEWEDYAFPPVGTAKFVLGMSVIQFIIKVCRLCRLCRLFSLSSRSTNPEP